MRKGEENMRERIEKGEEMKRKEERMTKYEGKNRGNVEEKERRSLQIFEEKLSKGGQDTRKREDKRWKR